MAALGIFGFIIFLGVGVVQIYAGFIGIEYHLGYWWAIAAVGASFLLRIMLPLTIGTFFGALDVWGWPWYGAAALAAPDKKPVIGVGAPVYTSGVHMWNGTNAILKLIAITIRAAPEIISGLFVPFC